MKKDKNQMRRKIIRIGICAGTVVAVLVAVILILAIVKITNSGK